LSRAQESHEAARTQAETSLDDITRQHHELTETHRQALADADELKRELVFERERSAADACVLMAARATADEVTEQLEAERARVQSLGQRLTAAEISAESQHVDANELHEKELAKLKDAHRHSMAHSVQQEELTYSELSAERAVTEGLRNQLSEQVTALAALQEQLAAKVQQNEAAEAATQATRAQRDTQLEHLQTRLELAEDAVAREIAVRRTVAVREQEQRENATRLRQRAEDLGAAMANAESQWAQARTELEGELEMAAQQQVSHSEGISYHIGFHSVRIDGHFSGSSSFWVLADMRWSVYSTICGWGATG
jgi:hypothetical protein